ncbi:hypothetical protein [Youxingia wuxianensis]|uniref:Peptidase C39-like domain-containing protein n=1 Tax=Youxingia wuxianensis TaxID=2763678 RepID=A0A926ERQ6_9FIRM|nr:hypothetical protein [Youxingia wuxianensis]MBC8586232.1 hypothetical protein [Youxingia wuxianensis]
MKFFGKKLLSMLLAITMVVSLGVTVSAAESTNGNDEYIKVTDEIVESIAVEWAEYICPGRSFNVSAIYEYYNLDDELIGYSVSVTSNGTPYGYILLDFFQENIITEFVIEEDVVNICESAVTELQSHTSTYGLRGQSIDSSCVRLHKYLPLVHAVSVEVGGTEVYAIDDEVTSRNEYEKFCNSVSATQTIEANVRSIDEPWAIYDKNSQNETVYGHCADIMLKSIPTGYTVVDKDTRLEDRYSFSQSWAETNTDSYACAIIAGLNILYQTDSLLNDSSVDTYEWLWDETGTKETTASKNDTTSDIVYGSTTIGKIAPAIVKLAKELGKTNSSYSNVSSPTYQTYKTAVNAGKSGVLEFGVTVSTDDGTARQGHTVSVVGFRSDKDSNSTVHQYVIVADGWGSYRYMELSAIDFTDKSGATIVIG